jgi:DNA-binding NarL/FixJ family response regulator
LVIENQEVAARGLKSALLSRGYTHVHYSLSPEEARVEIAQREFNILLVARTVGSHDGIALSIELRKLLPSAVIVMLALETPWTLAEEVQASGANALIGTSIPLPTLIDLLADLWHHRERFIFVGDRVASDGMDELTLSEREILTQLSSGLTTREIAKNRHNSEATIKSHLTSIYRKLGVRNRVEAIAQLYRS